MKTARDPDEEARRLKARFANVRNQAAWARTHKLAGGASMLSQHIHGRRPINLDAAIVYAAAFGVSLADISPHLAEQQQRAQEVAPLGHVLYARENRASSGHPTGASGLRAALQTLRDAVGQAPASAQPEIRLRMQALLEGIEPESSIERLCELLGAPSAAPTRKRRAA